MGSKRKNQHFVPKFYLRNFSYLGNGKQIGLYNTKTKFYFGTAPIKSQGARDFFYGTDGIVEEGLSNIEGHLSTVINKILESDSIDLNQDENLVLLLFIVLTNLRNPSNIVGFSETWIKMKEKLLEDSPETDNIDEIIPIPSHEDSVKLSLGLCLEMVEAIKDLKFKVLVNLTDTPFITSDNPVVRYNQYLEWRRWKHPKTGFGMIGLQIFIPLNYKKTLFLYDSYSYEIGNPDFKTYYLKKAEDIDQINLLQFINCIETIYFDEKVDEAYMKDMQEWANEFNKANIPYSELRYIIENESDLKNGNMPDKKNLVINGATECVTNLKISGLKIKSTVKSRKLNNSVAQPRPGSSIYKEI